MTLSRRRFLAAGATGAAAALAHRAADPPAGLPRPNIAWAAGCDTPMPAPSPEAHLLNRATYGPTAAAIAEIRRLGIPAWLDQQLSPAGIDDAACELALEDLWSIKWDVARIKQENYQTGRPIANELVANSLYRAVASRRQLAEMMAEFWSNHFNVYHPEEFTGRAKTFDEREVIRPHVLGKFRDLVHGVAASSTMMRYLNTARNTKDGPNENFARELMELHVLGVDGGYTEQDIKQVARCFTGWNVNNTTWTIDFRSADHAPGDKTVLGQRIASGGVDEGHAVIDILVDHPSCARHLAGRLCQRFIADSPPAAVVDKVAAAFGKDGDIPAMLRALFLSSEFAASAALTDAAGRSVPAKVRRPMEHWAAILRALEVEAYALLQDLPKDAYEEQGAVYGDRAEGYLQAMDHLPFRWHAPDGYPDKGPWWSGMHVMLSKWNFALALTEGRIPGMTVDLWAQMQAAGIKRDAGAVVDYWAGRLLTRALLAADRQNLVAFLIRGASGGLSESVLRARLPVLVALLCDSPNFHWR